MKAQQRRGSRKAWVIAGALLLGIGLLASQAYSASMPVTSQPIQNMGTDGALTYSADWSAGSSVVTRHESSNLTLNVSDQITTVTVGGNKASGAANVSVTLKDKVGATLDSGSGSLVTAAGAYTTAVTLTGGTTAYSKMASVSAAYTGGSVPIAFDAASSTSGVSTGLTWAHTVGAAGTNRILVVGISFDLRGSSITGVTYGGQALTFIGSSSSAKTRMELWYIVAPPTGTNNVVVTGIGIAEKIGGATSWAGVHQTAPLGTAAFALGTSTTPSVNVTSAAGEVVVDTLATIDAESVTVGAGQTQRWNVSQGDYRGGGSSAPGAATVTMSWTLPSSFQWSIGAVPLKQAQP